MKLLSKKVVSDSKSREKINPRAIHKEYIDKKEESLAKQGVVFFDTDDGSLNINSGFLSLPYEITDIPSRDLGEYLNAFTQQKLYLRTILGRTEYCMEQAKRTYFQTSTLLYKRYTNDKYTESAKERLVNSDANVKPSYEIYSDWKHKVGLVKNSIANIEDAIFLISREVTRRDSDFNDENRTHNVGKKKRF